MGASYARNGSNHHELLVGLRRSFASKAASINKLDIQAFLV
jgi:hypothetical protein